MTEENRDKLSYMEITDSKGKELSYSFVEDLEV